jgi:hypothetical protein
MKLPRHGIVEIETLRRYGRVPIGTRAVGSFALWGKPVPPGHRRFEFLQTHIQVGDDPRIVMMNSISDWTAREDRPHTWHTMHRKKMQAFHAADLSGHLLQSVTNYLEGLSTGTGQQRFKVVRIEWQDEAPLPPWVIAEMGRWGLVPPQEGQSAPET